MSSGHWLSQLAPVAPASSKNPSPAAEPVHLEQVFPSLGWHSVHWAFIVEQGEHVGISAPPPLLFVQYPVGH